MKKTLLFALLFGGLAFAQDKEPAGYLGKGDVEFGAGIGISFSTVSSDEIDAGTITGFNAAFSADYFFNDRWSIKGKLIYDQKGFGDAYFIDIDGTYETDIRLTYVTIPVMANWHFGANRQWYLNFGPYASFLMSAKETEGGNDVKDGFNSNDFGLEIGIGVKIPLNDQLKLYIEYEDSAGLSNINKGDGDLRNTRGGFNVGLNFILK
jgi:opacity protein-like surface antigen